MATVFETRLIGNVGKDAVVRKMEKGVLALNFPVAHNKNWRDKRTGEQRTKTTWVNCTIWKKDGTNLRILDFLKKGSLVEVIGTPFAKGYLQDDQSIKSEIRLNVSKTNILKASSDSTSLYKDYDDELTIESAEIAMAEGIY
ncbi:MAG: single-stranded DNA-binding protein [Crocinitomix sp.]|nr:single-stranded DNA-binding protein [Crocinitomix sp.]